MINIDIMGGGEKDFSLPTLNTRQVGDRKKNFSGPQSNLLASGEY